MDQFQNWTLWLTRKVVRIFKFLLAYRGFGFVIFKEKESADMLISCRYFYINNNKIECKQATPKNELSQNAITTIFKEEHQDKKIFVGGLDVSIDDRKLIF